jgi:hypothetical protein
MNDLNIVHLQNVFVGNHGIIFDKQGNIIDLNLQNDHFGVNSHLRSFMVHQNDSKFDFNLVRHAIEAKEQIQNNSFIQVDDDYPYIHAFHFYNIYVWGHLWDSLNNLEDFENSSIDFRLATSQLTTHVKDLDLHFNLCGYKKNHIVSFPYKGRLYKFKNLYVSTINTPACFIRNKQWIEQKYIHENPYLIQDKNITNCKLFLSRNEYGKDRRTLNEDKVWDILQKHGYIKLNGTEGLLQHIKYFSNAISIICTHGSMEKNIAFCLNKDVEIWEFHPFARFASLPAYGADNVFQRMSRHMGINKHFFLPIESDKNQNVELDLDLIMKISKS